MDRTRIVALRLGAPRGRLAGQSALALGLAMAFGCSSAPPDTDPGFQMFVMASAIEINHGEVRDVQVTILRADPSIGEVRLRFEALPAGVTADPVVLPVGADAAHLTLRAAPDAPFGNSVARVLAISHAGRRETDLPIAVRTPGRPVEDFGDGGTVRHALGNFAGYAVSDVTTDTKGRILIALHKRNDTTVLRLLADGAWDETFRSAGVDGIVAPRFVADLGGAIVLAGRTKSFEGVLAALDESGNPIQSWGDLGLCVIDGSSKILAVRPWRAGLEIAGTVSRESFYARVDETCSPIHSANRNLTFSLPTAMTFVEQGLVVASLPDQDIYGKELTAMFRMDEDAMLDSRFGEFEGFTARYGIRYSLIETSLSGDAFFGCGSTLDAGARVPVLSRWSKDGLKRGQFGVGGDYSPMNRLGQSGSCVEFLEMGNGSIVVLSEFLDGGREIRKINATGMEDRLFGDEGLIQLAGIQSAAITTSMDGCVVVAGAEPESIVIQKLHP